MWPQAVGPLYYAGIGVYAVLAALIGQRLRLRPHVPIAISVCYLVGMTACAKALFDLRAGHLAASALVSPDHYARGGMWLGPVAYLLLAAGVVPLVTRERKRALDLIALATPLPLAVGKLVCLCAGCCHGKPCGLPWAITFPAGKCIAPAGVPLHPSQLYDVAVLLCAAAVLFRVNRPFWQGTLLAWLVGLVGVGKLLTEFSRWQEAGTPTAGGLSLVQWFYAGAAFVAAALLAVHGVSARRGHPSTPLAAS